MDFVYLLFGGIRDLVFRGLFDIGCFRYMGFIFEFVIYMGLVFVGTEYVGFFSFNRLLLTALATC